MTEIHKQQKSNFIHNPTLFQLSSKFVKNHKQYRIFIKVGLERSDFCTQTVGATV